MDDWDAFNDKQEDRKEEGQDGGLVKYAARGLPPTYNKAHL